jgi:hypothetical protein
MSFSQKLQRKTFFIITYFKYRSYKVFPEHVCLTEIMVKIQHGCNCSFLLCSQRREGWLSVCGKTRILLENSDMPIERSHKKITFLIDALVQKIQLDEHSKFRCYVMFATMDMLKYRKRIVNETKNLSV